MVARAVAEDRGYAKVVLVPSARPPHKPDAAELADACHRLAMCQVVSQCDSMFETDGIELERDGPSFTLETARALKKRGWGEVAWLIGADMVQILPTWHHAEALLREVTLVIAKRPGHEIDWNKLPQAFQVLRNQVVAAPMIDISASAIRARVREGRPIRYMVPPEVERYIAEHRLYGADR
jgi:nicotinate-nucleotide adenylyltransferase